MGVCRKPIYGIESALRCLTVDESVVVQDGVCNTGKRVSISCPVYKILCFYGG